MKPIHMLPAPALAAALVLTGAAQAGAQDKVLRWS